MTNSRPDCTQHTKTEMAKIDILFGTKTAGKKHTLWAARTYKAHRSLGTPLAFYSQQGLKVIK